MHDERKLLLFYKGCESFERPYLNGETCHNMKSSFIENQRRFPMQSKGYRNGSRKDQKELTAKAFLATTKKAFKCAPVLYVIRLTSDSELFSIQRYRNLAMVASSGINVRRLQIFAKIYSTWLHFFTLARRVRRRYVTSEP